MANGEAAHDTGRLNVAAAVAVLVLGAWCAPALASSGVDIRCPESESALDTPLVSVSPSLAAHQDSAIEEILDHEPISMPTLAETATESDIETLGDTDAVREETTPTARRCTAPTFSGSESPTSPSSPRRAGWRRTV